jgi:transposase
MQREAKFDRLWSMSTTYPGNLSEAEWECLQQHLPSEPSRGRPRSHSLREIFNAIFYVLRTGCPWRYLPSNFPPWQTVFYHFRCLRLKGIWYRLFTALRVAERERGGRNAQPSAVIMDAASVSRPSRSQPGSVAMMPTSTSRAARGTSSLIRWACRSPSTSPLPMSMTPKELVTSWPGSLR